MATMVAAFTARRVESRGAHYRADHPDEAPAWQRSQIARLIGEEIVFEGNTSSIPLSSPLQGGKGVPASGGRE